MSLRTKHPVRFLKQPSQKDLRITALRKTTLFLLHLEDRVNPDPFMMTAGNVTDRLLSLEFVSWTDSHVGTGADL